jgi:hypothetical protein
MPERAVSPTPGLTVGSLDVNDWTIEELEARLADLQSRLADVESFTDLGMRQLQVNWVKERIEETERGLEFLRGKSKRR